MTPTEHALKDKGKDGRWLYVRLIAGTPTNRVWIYPKRQQMLNDLFAKISEASASSNKPIPLHELVPVSRLEMTHRIWAEKRQGLRAIASMYHDSARLRRRAVQLRRAA